MDTVWSWDFLAGNPLASVDIFRKCCPPLPSKQERISCGLCLYLSRCKFVILYHSLQRVKRVQEIILKSCEKTMRENLTQIRMCGNISRRWFPIKRTVSFCFKIAFLFYSITFKAYYTRFFSSFNHTKTFTSVALCNIEIR